MISLKEAVKTEIAIALDDIQCKRRFIACQESILAEYIADINNLYLLQKQL